MTWKHPLQCDSRSKWLLVKSSALIAAARQAPVQHVTVIPLCRKLEISSQGMQLLYLFANTATVHWRAQWKIISKRKASLFSILNATLHERLNYLGGQNDLRHLTWVAPVVSRLQMRALIWANPSPQNRTTEAVLTSIAGTESQTGKVINRWRRAGPVSLPASFFLSGCSPHHATSHHSRRGSRSGQLAQVAVTLGLCATSRSGLALLTRFASPSEHRLAHKVDEWSETQRERRHSQTTFYLQLWTWS